MKMEKLNDNQIRCTLTKADLVSREMKLSELSYGTEKAKTLFRDMVQEAFLKFGFEANDIPLMIEAIPVNPECIVLIITKVEDPEELDTRFSRFTPDMSGAEADDDIVDSLISREDIEMLNHPSLANVKSDIVDLCKRFAKGAKEVLEKIDDDKPHYQVIAKTYMFDSIADIVDPANALKGVFDDVNSLYKDEENNRYILALRKLDGTDEEFTKACNILSEYATSEYTLPTKYFYYQEHYHCLIKDYALQSLAMD